MRKKQNLLLIFLAALLSVSCEQDSYRHLVAIEYPMGMSQLYADQCEDSIIFDTFDSYNVFSSTPWIKTRQPLIDVPLANNYYQCLIAREVLTIEPNTTGECRYGFVNVRSHGLDGWASMASATYYQYSWHDIEHPVPSVTYQYNLPIAANFELKDSATCVVDTIRFRAHSDWTLELPESSFITSVSRTHGYDGHYAVILNYEPNNSYKADTVDVALVSTYLGVKTPIRIVREALKND